MKVDTTVSADLSSIGKASGHPLRWSIIVRMCLLPDVDTVSYVFLEILVHFFPIVLAPDEMVSANYSLVSEFVMGFH